MKHITLALTAFVAMGLFSVTVAAPWERSQSILISQVDDAAEVADQAVAEVKEVMPTAPPVAAELQGDAAAPVAVPDETTSAPMIDATQPAPVVAPPITAESVADDSAVVVHQHSAPVRYYRAPKKQNLFEKLMDMERKKNAWLKRTFLGQ
ncbi:hypothetical protein NHH03_08390 [Stieleria sp. TO1_6]|uniref:hypothetical protein n=1 Tax=Stieleria tagensis TaxID=2956795 RepID=UPI00209B4333|nr:hypothetical protein [Stieleria tagensis]MCO8121752.1 hypothetical protein [Stieleria tagensis]